MFESAEVLAEKSQSVLDEMQSKKIYTGISYLDDAFRWLSCNDLVLMGAYSGYGKTQFCANLATANIENEKKVYFIALEAFYTEIQTRHIFSHLAKLYFSDPDRPKLEAPLNYANYLHRMCGKQLSFYEQEAIKFVKAAYRDLFMFHKQKEFTVDSLIKAIIYARGNADLIILDHVHFFDWGDTPDSKALREIAMTARDMVLESNVPVVMVGHLRKKNLSNKELCPGPDEFHGTSDLVKVATKAFLMSSGGPDETGENYITYFRVVKNRTDGSCVRFLGKVLYNINKGEYQSGYEIGWDNTEKFSPVSSGQIPAWARPARVGSTDNRVYQPDAGGVKYQRGPRVIRNFAEPYQGD